ncbi:acyltransferase [Streptomyces sp. 549]|uniref:acyltransferase family protein n=1 Tax=Streptomyces sp. 549 TaxID=3049076 RepID=UPI0024C43762|nr:acyltransferase [Streptomyces sp. 549]MDK1473856.1 acyltransferase [Streptomyces sp. 549]
MTTSTPARPGAEAARPPVVRDRYLDLLRALALVRVVVYHTFGWAWLTFLFPSMGVMFALAGSLMARSLQRPALGVIRSRVRRLLLPLWLYGVLVLSILFAQGWGPAKGEETWFWLRIVCWVVPVGSPPFPWHIGSEDGFLTDTWAVQAAAPLWYLRAYFWFVLLSPLLLKAFRRMPWTTLLAPLGLTAIVGTGLVTIPGQTGSAVTDFATFGACWVLGFAHQDGLLKKIPGYLAPSVAPFLMVFGLWWATAHPGPDGLDLNDIPLAQAFWSFGFCLILLSFSPSWERLPGRLARWEKPVTLANNRAVTLYLWHEIALIATIPLLDPLWKIPGVWPDHADLLTSMYPPLMFILVWPLTALFILLVGWAEDVAAKRRPRLWPTTR